MHLNVFVVGAIFYLSCLGRVHATERTSLTVQVSDRRIKVESVLNGASGQHPAVVILSGSKGFGSPAYDEMTQVFEQAGLDVFLLHFLASDDLDAIATAGSARSRIAYYATHLSRWTESVRAVVDHLNAEPRYMNKVGVLGISLGAQVAAAASIDHDGVRALVLVDGAYPDGYAPPVRASPPLRLIWGSADRVFPLSIAQKLIMTAKTLHWDATLGIYERGAHDFFLRSASPQAKAAQDDAAEFLKKELR